MTTTNDKSFDEQIDKMKRALVRGAVNVRDYHAALQCVAELVTEQRKRFDPTTVYVHGLDVLAEAGGAVFKIVGRHAYAMNIGIPEHALQAGVVEVETPFIRKIRAEALGIRRVK